MADWEEIEAYALAWNIDENRGAVQMRLKNGDMAKIPLDTAPELAAIGDILRNESPSFFSATRKAIRTGWEISD